MNLAKSAVLSGLLLLMPATSSYASPPLPPGSSDGKPVVALSQVLTQLHQCSPSLQLRAAALTPVQQSQICLDLAAVHQRFMTLFNQPAPVLHDGNQMLRANIYQSQQQYAALAGQHFSMPTDNGGMYLEGLPHLSGNQAEFVAYQRADGAVWNLAHEYVHYLDGRFNLAGDFCANLHDSHAAPENCPHPAPQSPYLVWWTEGMAEYVAHGTDNLAAERLASTAAFTLSELFHTGYETNTGSDRVYRWGYLAVRYLFEKHPEKIQQMLSFTRNGDYPRYQALVQSWGTSMDAEFAHWLQTFAAETTPLKAHSANTTTP